MKNFSTGVARSLAARTAIAAAAAWLLAGSAQAAAECAFRPDAPDQHVVVPRDTLWGISGTFLEHPWCWPQVWGLNRDEIKNPHWIYPGQVVYFDRAHGRLSLNRPGAGGGAAGSGEPGLAKLSPQLRTEEIQGGAIQAVSREVIDGLVSKSLIVAANQLESAPRIAASVDVSRIYLGKNDRIYVRGNLNGVSDFQVYRPGKALVDPDNGRVMAYEATNVGTAHLVALAKPGVDVNTFEVTSSLSEISVGDRLRPITPAPELNYVPHAPQQAVHGRVMSIASESNVATQAQIVTVNRGEVDGLDIGSTLVLYHPGQTVKDPGGSSGFLGFGQAKLRLPDEVIGNLFIFRVYEHVAYGLIMESKAPITVGDMANSPE